MIHYRYAVCYAPLRWRTAPVGMGLEPIFRRGVRSPGVDAGKGNPETGPVVFQASAVASQSPSMPKPGSSLRYYSRIPGAGSDSAGSGGRLSGIGPHV